MTPDFDLGRQFERQEVATLLGYLVSIEDDNQLRTLLEAWSQEVQTSLPKTYIVITEAHYVLSPQT